MIFCKIFAIFLLIKLSEALRCRTDDGPSDAELKRVTRNCMRKFGENFLMQNTQQQQLTQQQAQQSNYQLQGRYNNNNNNNNNNNHNSPNRNQRTYKNAYGNFPDYNDENNNESDSRDNEDFHQFQQHYGSQYDNNGGRQNNNGRGSGNTALGNSNGYNDDDRYGIERNHQRFNYQNKSNATGNQRNQMGRTTNNNGNNQNSNSYHNYNSNRNRNSNNQNNNSHNNNHGNSNNHNSNSSADSACIVHCFFEELQMLGNNHYPDRHKVLFILTRDIRDRELRNVYTDTIQECFRYLETQRRRDKCQFSRDLISCMMEYSKGNCDDWNEFNMMFN